MSKELKFPEIPKRSNKIKNLLKCKFYYTV